MADEGGTAFVAGAVGVVCCDAGAAGVDVDGLDELAAAAGPATWTGACVDLVPDELKLCDTKSGGTTGMPAADGAGRRLGRPRGAPICGSLGVPLSFTICGRVIVLRLGSSSHAAGEVRPKLGANDVLVGHLVPTKPNARMPPKVCRPKASSGILLLANQPSGLG